MSEFMLKQLGELVQFSKGKTYSVFSGPTAVPIIGAAEMSGGIPTLFATPHIPVKLCPDDLIMLWDGERSGLVSTGHAGLVGSTASRLRVNQNIINPKYLYYHLQQSFDWIQARRTGTGVPHVPSNIGSELALTIHTDITEQRRIANVLSTLDEQIQQTELIILKSNLRAKGLMTDLLSCRQLSRQDVSDVLLSEVIPVVQYGISTSLDVEGVIPVLRMNNLSRGEISVLDLKYSPSSVSSNLLLHPGDVLFNRTNSMEHVGRTSIWRGQLAEATFASYLVRLKPDLSKLLPEYLVYLLEWEVNQLQMRKYATPGVQQVNINPTSLRKCRVCLPNSLVVQRDVVAVLDSSREQVSALREEGAKLRLQKQGLMRDLLTGKTRIQ